MSKGKGHPKHMKMDETMNKPKQFILPIILAIIALSTVPGCSKKSFSGSDDNSSKKTTKAQMGPLLITVTNPGVVQADKKINIINELKYWVSIISVRDEGELVKKGDIIVEYECKELKNQIESRELQLDSSELTLEQTIKQQTIEKKQSEVDLINAENSVLTATENLAVYEKVSKSLLAVAEDRVARAKETLNRYIEKGGVWENSLKDAETAIRMNQKSLGIEKEKLDFKIKVNNDPALESPYSTTEIQGHAMLVTQLENTLQKSIRTKDLLIKYDNPNIKRQLEEAVTQAETNLALLTEFTVPQKFRTLKAAMDQAELNLDKTKTKRESTLALKEFEIKGKEAILKKVKKSLKELLEEKEKLKVEATTDGIILYRPGWKPGGTRPIEPEKGERLYPKAKLIEIPDMTTLMVKTELLDFLNIHLKRGGKVKGGTEVTFTLDAIPGKKFKGHVLHAIPNRAVLDSISGKQGNENESDTVQGNAFKGYNPDAGPGDVVFRGNVLKTSPLPKDTGTHFMKSGVSAYDVFIEVDWEAAGLTPGENLIPGMSSQVTLNLVNIKNTLSIPIVSLYSRDNIYYCRKMADGKEIEQRIIVGLRNESRVEVLDGLKEGDEVLLVGDEDSQTKS
jgi:multidrug efflux pump subunit AcrA (membrane-fusion protein)